MSKISQELKTLLYLNERYSRSKWVTIKEISDYLEVSTRQARRYLDDLNLIPEIEVITKLGRDGGYRLVTPLDKGFALPENIALALSIAMKKNKRIEEVLSSLPHYVITDVITGDNQIDNKTLDVLEVLIKAIKDQKEITFAYRDLPNRLYVQPYKIVLTNHAYYLFALDDGTLKKYNARFIDSIDILGSFKVEDAVTKEIEERLGHYGIMSDQASTLKVRCKDEETLHRFDRYYEGKGIMDKQELTYEVSALSEHELYYPLFHISTKAYRFLDEGFKKRYITYLRNQIKSLEQQ